MVIAKIYGILKLIIFKNYRFNTEDILQPNCDYPNLLSANIMLVKKFNQAIITLFGNTSISTILIVPFVVQVVGATGLVGYLSFRTGKSAIADLANQLIEEVSDRIYQNLELYLEIPAKINQKKLDAIELGFGEYD
ncbi:histidine kinase [Limnospira fusiformis CCALA 023]